MCSRGSFSSLQNEWTPKSSLELSCYQPFVELINPSDRGEKYCSNLRSMAYPTNPNNLDSRYSQYTPIKENYCCNRADNYNTYLPLEKTSNGQAKNIYETYCQCASTRYNQYNPLDNTYTPRPYFETYGSCCGRSNYNSLDNTSKGQARNVFETYPVDPEMPNDVCKKGTYQSLNNNWHAQKLYEL
jgi:hypothetical protein